MTLIQASTTTLTANAPQFQYKGGVVDEYSLDIQSTTKGLSDTLSGMSELGGLDGNIDTLGKNLKIVMQCHSDALHRTSRGLLTTAQSIQKTDADMASTLKAIEVGLEPYTGYEVPIPKRPTKQPDTPWYDTAWKWVVGIGSGVLAYGATIQSEPATQETEQIIEELAAPFV